MKCKQFAALGLCLALGLAGCGSTRQPLPSCSPEEDRKLTVYTSHKPNVSMPIIREFEERTGIWVNVVSGGTSEMLEQIRSEQDAPVADVMFGGGVESLTAYGDCFEPYLVSEELILTAEDVCWTPFSYLPVVLIYHTKLVRPQELTGWADLLRPDFRGRVAFADPAVSGSSFTAMVTALEAGLSIEELASAVTVLDSSGDVLTAVSEGKAPVGITLEETALKAIDAGMDIAIVYPREGTSCVPDGSALVKNAPHPENARAFLEFTVSHDVQSLLVSQEHRRSVRPDVADSLPALDELALVSYDFDWVCDHRESLLEQWQTEREAVQ